MTTFTLVDSYISLQIFNKYFYKNQAELKGEIIKKVPSQRRNAIEYEWRGQHTVVSVIEDCSQNGAALIVKERNTVDDSKEKPEEDQDHQRIHSYLGWN